MKRRGRVSPTRAARLLGVHTNTVYDWCRRAERGDELGFPTSSVERDDSNGYLYISLQTVLDVRRTRLKKP